MPMCFRPYWPKTNVIVNYVAQAAILLAESVFLKNSQWFHRVMSSFCSRLIWAHKIAVCGAYRYSLNANPVKFIYNVLKTILNKL